MDSTEKSLRIRRMRAADAEEVSQIYGRITQEPVRDDFKQLVEEHSHNEHAVCIVAELDGCVVGFMISFVHAFGFGIERGAWIATLGVDPRHMGQGIGGKLAQETLSAYRAQGITSVHTSVRWDSTDMLSFFKSLGFVRSDFINLAKVLK